LRARSRGEMEKKRKCCCVEKKKKRKNKHPRPCFVGERKGIRRGRGWDTWPRSGEALTSVPAWEKKVRKESDEKIPSLLTRVGGGKIVTRKKR